MKILVFGAGVLGCNLARRTPHTPAPDGLPRTQRQTSRFSPAAKRSAHLRACRFPQRRYSLSDSSAGYRGSLCASDHAMNAVDEMSALNRDLKAFFDENGAKYSVWQELEQEVAKYLK